MQSQIRGKPGCDHEVGDFELIYDCMHQCWEHVGDFQADSLVYLMENNGYEVVFSHFHAPDLQKHMFIRNLAKGTENTTAEQYEFIMQAIYTQIDRYLGKFVHFLDQGWTLVVTSDHAQVCPKHGLRGLGDTGCNIQIMEELGYTVRAVNPETGKKRRAMDWTKTTAVYTFGDIVWEVIHFFTIHIVSYTSLDGVKTIEHVALHHDEVSHTIHHNGILQGYQVNPTATAFTTGYRTIFMTEVTDDS